MKYGKFYGLGNTESLDYKLLEYVGDIIDYKDLSLGVTKIDGKLFVIELTTGLSIIKRGEIKFKNQIKPLLDGGRYDLIKRLLNEDYVKKVKENYQYLIKNA